MVRSFFSDLTTVMLAKCLDACGLRQRVIANNIANVETPGFTRSEVAFESRLKEALEATSEESAISRIEKIQPEIIQDNISPARPNGNNVSIEKEMADMTKNSMQYEALVQLMNLKAAMIRMAMNEGRR
ncbi:MAG: flagellar basal body rod protein FlgB [Armatimonadota bacterium]|nr:flagellar basal body rod protein FlgB [Armatimonadota bacterium]